MLKIEREADVRAEKNIGKFLNQNLFTQIKASTSVIFERIIDKERQFAGIDVFVGQTKKRNTVTTCLSCLRCFQKFFYDIVKRRCPK